MTQKSRRARGALPSLFPRKVRGVPYQIARFGDQQRSYGRWGDKDGVAEFEADLAVWIQNGRAWPEEPERDEPAPDVEPAAPVGSLPVVELVDRYLAARRFEDGEKWWADNGSTLTYTLKKQFCELNGTVLAGDVGPATLLAFQRHLCGLRRKDGVTSRLTVKSVNEKVTAVVAAFSWAVSEELVPGGLAAALREVSSKRAVKKGRPGMRVGVSVSAPAQEWIDAIMPYYSKTLAIMVKLGVILGTRPKELIGLRVGDIDRSETPWRAHLAKHKTASKGKARTILFPPAARTLLEPLLLRPAGRLLFTDPDGQPWTTRSWSAAMKKAWRRCNAARKAKGLDPVPWWRPRSTRHLASERLRDEFDVEVAAAILGHTTAEMTEKHYAGPALKKAAEAIERVG